MTEGSWRYRIEIADDKYNLVGNTVLDFHCRVGFAQPPAPVAVEPGFVQGTSEDGLANYRGIPFAAPPVVDLRWRAPQPAAKWPGVRQATNFDPSPVQGMRSGPEMSEDCLYLNVWKPAKSSDDQIPVLV
jgi:para-nitrobenzyl esterase